MFGFIYMMKKLPAHGLNI